MIESRDSTRGEINFAKTGLVPGKVISRGVVKLERVQVICLACGQQVEAVTRNGRGKGYCVVARQSVDFPIETQRVPTETRAKLSATIKKHWQDPEYQAKQRAAQKKHWQDPEYQAKQRAAQKKHWQDPEYQAKQRAIQSAVMKKRWQEYRNRQIATHTGKHHTAETRAKISTALKARHNKKAMKNND